MGQIFSILLHGLFLLNVEEIETQIVKGFPLLQSILQSKKPPPSPKVKTSKRSGTILFKLSNWVGQLVPQVWKFELCYWVGQLLSLQKWF